MYTANKNNRLVSKFPSFSLCYIIRESVDSPPKDGADIHYYVATGNKAMWVYRHGNILFLPLAEPANRQPVEVSATTLL